jgi:hypothetical protein
MTPRAQADAQRVAELLVEEWANECGGVRIAPRYISDLTLAIAAALSTTAAQAEARGMRRAAEIAANFYPHGPAMGQEITGYVAAAILAQTTGEKP